MSRRFWVLPRLLLASWLWALLGILVAGCGGAARAKAPTVVAHRACPHEDRIFAPGADPGARTRMVPGRPAGVLVCRYWGQADAGPRWTLAGERTVGGGVRLLAFARRLNALRPIPTAPAPSCPVLGGRSVLLLFRYPTRPDDPVRIVRSGCVDVSNGHLRERFGLALGMGEHWPDEGIL